ncbi:MAG: glycosyltransferase family 4 protein [Pseudomonadota bacterium]
MGAELAASWPAAAVAFAVAVLGTRRLLGWLTERRILDLPNHRSSHSLPTPRGGGLAVTPAALAAWVMVAVSTAQAGWIWTLAAGGGALMAASWLDDRHSLPALPRLGVHALAVTAGLLTLPGDALVFQGWLPVAADRVLTALGWLWFVNLYNFMDGIDGITGVETVSLGFGIALVAIVAGVAAPLAPLGIGLAAAAIGFLVWNWHPARIFLGDSGSVPLGFLLGGLLVHLAAAGHLAAAVILPAYYLADASITLGRRTLRGEKVWQAHRQHFYQRAVQGGRSHDQVALAILGANLVLGCAALLSVTRPATGVALGAAATAMLLTVLARWAGGGRP